MNKIELIGNMVSLRNEIRIALFQMAHEQNSSLGEYIHRDELPTWIWAIHEEFAVLHDEYVALKQGIVALA